METIKPFLFLLIFSILLIAGCTSQRHGAGEYCTKDTDCYDDIKCVMNACGCSTEAQYCQQDKDCCDGLNCRGSKCKKLPMYCEFRDMTGPAALISVPLGLLGIICLVLGIGTSLKASYRMNDGTTITIAGAGLILIILAGLLFALSLGVSKAC